MLYFFIMILSIFVASRGDLMYENITGVAAMSQYHQLTVAFTLFCALFFAYKMYQVLILLKRQDRLIKIFILIAVMMMIIGAFCPYTRNGHDIFSQLHVICSMLPSLIFLILLFIYTRFLSFVFPHIYIRIHWFYDMGLQFLCLLLIVFTRVNGYLEICFTILVCTYLYLIETTIIKEISINEDF